MYQYYYANKNDDECLNISHSIYDIFSVERVRVTMWEEHCLECSAPLCYKSCLNYIPRQDGRCKLLENGIKQSLNKHGLLDLSADVKFRKWGNLLTIVYPTMITLPEYQKITKKLEKWSELLQILVNSKINTGLKWGIIRSIEYIRRKYLMNVKNKYTTNSDAFILHVISHQKESFRLLMEVYSDKTSVFKTSFLIDPGENLQTLNKIQYSTECDKTGNIIKLYPENNICADITILWSDFVTGKLKQSEKPDKKVKCVVWDLDNTIWDGILIETENPDKLELRSGVLETILELDRRGIIQSIASKNDKNSALKQMKRLKIDEYFIYPHISWDAKSESIKSIAKLLNINVDSFTFIDDSIFERNQVKSQLPQVRIEDEHSVPGILKLEHFNVVITAESRKRRLMYHDEEKRIRLKEKSNTADIASYIKECEIEIQLFTPKTQEELTRCYELLQRTNQLNLSGNKYSMEEYKKIIENKNVTSIAFSCCDKFGEYGIVCFAQYEIINNELIFKEFAMSCRIAGKFIESAFFSYLCKKENTKRYCFNIIKTEKNTLLRNTVQNIGFVIVSEDSKFINYEFNENLKSCDLIKIRSKS